MLDTRAAAALERLCAAIAEVPDGMYPEPLAWERIKAAYLAVEQAAPEGELDTGQADGAWTVRAAREVTTDGVMCGLHGYRDCGICAGRAARWLIGRLAKQNACEDTAAELDGIMIDCRRADGALADAGSVPTGNLERGIRALIVERDAARAAIRRVASLMVKSPYPIVVSQSDKDGWLALPAVVEARKGAR
jgi:hypothetical protein